MIVVALMVVNGMVIVVMVEEVTKQLFIGDPMSKWLSDTMHLRSVF